MIDPLKRFGVPLLALGVALWLGALAYVLHDEGERAAVFYGASVLATVTGFRLVWSR